MRVHVYPADEGGCGYYRLIWPAQVVKQSGVDVKIFLPNTEGAQIQSMCYRDQDGREQLHSVLDPECDVVVLQRPLQRLLADTIPLLQKWGVKVIVEVDDDFHSVNPQNVAWRAADPKRDPDRNRDHLMRACALADRVTVTTAALLDRYGRKSGLIIPNYVPRWYTTVEKEWHEPVRVGWSGDIATHPQDLQELGSTLSMIQRYGYGVFIVGSGKGVGQRLGIVGEVMTSGWVALEQYPWQMAEIDIGVVPLKIEPFNHAKSWLKGLEFAALGVPFIASPTGPYEMLHHMYGIGELASRPKRWLQQIVKTSAQRQDLGRLYRERVILQNMTIEARGQLWSEAWTVW
jgi:hypothetical protein